MSTITSAPARSRKESQNPVPTLADLLAFARATAADPAVLAQLTVNPEERTWVRLEGPMGSEAWLIGWPPGSETGWHDHGGSSGAFVTASGELSELSLGLPIPTAGWRSLELMEGVDRHRALPAGRGRSFGPHHVHQVVNPSEEQVAVSVHCYYPPLPMQRRYARTGDTLRLALVEGPEEW
ncbi:cysteine dioxygenase [Streptacidiphilus sp. N1-12]|uniref:Cysteine dioxygenase n=2 Tax=Streptacidiphilus alkalitolerans TaxID=3342712 RepID=A0ABV6X8J7_9ACTN